MELEVPLEMEETPLDLTEERRLRELGGETDGEDLSKMVAK